MRLAFLSGDGLKARALRGTGFTVAELVGSNLMRLASNLVLTRILFPEAFGLMALMQTIIQGLRLLSDTGLGPSIVRSDRGDDPDFLNTAWTVQVIRGVLLWVLICALAAPVAAIYEEPVLLQMLPVLGLSLIISGFNTTKSTTANRHLRVGLLTAVNLGSYAAGILVLIGLSLWLQSVWALVIGGVIAAAITMAAQHLLLPGLRNRFRWEPAAFWEIFHFGKFVFLSSALTFVMNAGDKLVLGRYLTFEAFGIFSIGLMLATLPLMLSRVVISKVLLPIYRQRPITESDTNRRNLFRVRRLVVAGGLAMAGGLALIGVPLVEFLYDPRYAQAGAVVVLVCVAVVPQIMIASYWSALMSLGDSKGHFYLVLAGALLQILFLYIGVTQAGTFGVILAPAAVNLCLIPILVSRLQPFRAWDSKGDLALYAGGFALTGLACLIYRDQVLALIN